MGVITHTVRQRLRAHDVRPGLRTHVLRSTPSAVQSFYDRLVASGLSASVVWHYALSETSGTTAEDASTSDLAGTFQNGPTLAQDPLGYGDNVHSIGMNSAGARILAPNASIDFGNESWTFFCRAQQGPTSTYHGLFGVYITSGFLHGQWASNGVFRFDFYNGVTLARISLTGLNDGDPHRYVLRYDAVTEEITLFVDGVERGRESTAGIHPATLSSLPIRLGGGYIGGNGPDRMEVPVLFSSALTDAQCEAL